MNVEHDSKKKSFFVNIEGNVAELNYRNESDGVLNFYRTFTPLELRGKGLAGQITKVALQYAKDNNYKIIPGCPYVASYIEKNPEFAELLK